MNNFVSYPIPAANRPLVTVFANLTTTPQIVSYLGATGVTLQPGDRRAEYGTPTEVADRRAVGVEGRRVEYLAADLAAGRVTILSYPWSNNPPPVVIAPGNVAAAAGKAIPAQTVRVIDPFWSGADLTLAGVSDNQTLLPNSGITITGTGYQRSVALAPASGKTGTAVVTLTATNGDSVTATGTFNVVVS